MRKRRLAIVAASVAILALPGTASSAPPAAGVLPGYDLFRSAPGTRIGIPVGGTAVVEFRGVPIGSYDFGSGPVDVGVTDTIVRRLDAATPSDGRADLEVLALRLASVDPAGYYVTLQSARRPSDLLPPGVPSTGFMDIGFDDGGGGMFTSEFVIAYDVRAGSLAGPVVSSGTTYMYSVNRGAEPDGGGRTCSSVSACVAAVEEIGWDVAQTTEQFLTGQFVEHCDLRSIVNKVMDSLGIQYEGEGFHCHPVVEAPVLIEGVNYRLNGRNTANDFHAGAGS